VEQTGQIKVSVRIAQECAEKTISIATEHGFTFELFERKIISWLLLELLPTPLSSHSLKVNR